MKFSQFGALTLLTLLYCICTPLIAETATGSLSPNALRVEYSSGNLLGLDARNPRLSWKSSSTTRGALQSAYQIQAATSESDLSAEKTLWDSGKVKSDQSLFIDYKGPELKSRDRIVWRVRVWDSSDQPSAWSASASWEMGLISPEDWSAKWIQPAGPADTADARPATMLRQQFTIDGEVAKARVYASARGLYALQINGQSIGDQVLTPGWTSYHHRIQYQTYDVTNHLLSGDNALGAQLTDGWYRGYLTWEKDRRNVYGDQTAFLAQLHITYRDGRELVVGTDQSWLASKDGPYRKADIYDGETYDARREMAGWSTPGFDTSPWQNVALFDAKPVALVAPQGPPVRRMEEIQPLSITRAPNGETLVDMGQNMVGWIRLRVKGAAGTTITLRHAEVLDAEGNIYTENLRQADQTDNYILAGKSEEVYEPLFTFHGFRYVSLKGYPGELKPEDVTGVVVYSDMPRTGSWSSSDKLLNRLYQNIVWGQKGNFIDVPTDCPQRDERLGWTGDAQVFAQTAAFNMDVSGFFAKWLGDVKLDQLDNGAVPHVIPNVLDNTSNGTAGWADAATVIPWDMFQTYGDKGLLEAQYDSMVAWVDYMAAQAGEDKIWRPGFQFGDWLAPYIADTFVPYKASTGEDLIATAYFAHSANLVAKAAAILGKKGDERQYGRLFNQVRESFQREFITAAGRVAYETQTAYVLALSFELLPEKQRPIAAALLDADVQFRGNHLTTGFLGTPQLTRVLSDNGYTDTAYKLLNQTTYPSWLYPVTFGATTIWERWDALKPDGTFQSPEMTSFNHYAYGAVGDWMVNVVAGLEADPEVAGYKRTLYRPKPGGGLSHAQATLETVYGQASTAWAFHGAEFTLAVTVAANTSGTVVLPMAAGLAVTENGVPVASANGVNAVRKVGADLQLEIGSGSYQFSYSSPELAFKAANYVELNAENTVAEILAIPQGRKVIENIVPQMLGASLPPQVQMLPIGKLSKFLSPEVHQQLLKALEDSNTQRRAAILSQDKPAL